MLYTTHQIRTKAAGNVETDYTDILLDTPWVGFNMLPGQRWGDTLLTSGIKTLMNTTVLPDGTKVKDYWDKPSHAFRIFKSHFTPEVLPIKAYPKVKFLAMARNGMDVVSSFYPFFAGHRPAFKGVWGGFPPTYGSPMECLQDFLPGGALSTPLDAAASPRMWRSAAPTAAPQHREACGCAVRLLSVRLCSAAALHAYRTARPVL